MGKKNGKIAKTPVIMQMEALECGAASLTMVLAHYKKWIPLEQVRRDCGVSRDGSNARNILKAARNYGLEADGYRYELEDIKENEDYPCIIHWGFNHFVVLKGFKKDKAYINDPARGSCVVPMEEFDNKFTGICLKFKPTEAFEPSGKKKSMLDFAKKRMEGTGTAVAFVALTTMIVSLVTLVRSGFTRVFLDQLLTGYNPEWLTAFMFGYGLLVLIQIAVAWINAVYALRINGKMAVVGNTTYMWKVLQLPMEFFSQRMAGDIQQRKTTNANLAGNLVNTMAPLFLNTIMMVFYLVVMMRYSLLLTVVGISSVCINIALSRYISGKRVNISRVLMRDSGKLAASTVSGIEMIETIKSSGAENGYFEKWAGYQASVNTQNIRFAQLNQYLGLIPGLVQQLANIIVLVLGIYLVMQGKFTVGMVMAFQGFLSQFTAPAQALIGAGQVVQEMRTDMERIEDVMAYPSDPFVGLRKAGDVEYADPEQTMADAEQTVQGMRTDMERVEDVMAYPSDRFADSWKTEENDENVEYDKLSGAVELKNVTFGYSPLKDPLIKDFSMKLKQGDRVAFVGSSGCGKSTLANLICGLYQPWKGEILFDGKPISEIDHSIFTGSVAVVNQDIILFEDTIANNIKMWDTSIEDYEMILAARDAQIHDDIMARDGGYQYRLNEGGTDLSGGQRQRLEIARVLAQDPTIIVLDEATSALDAKTEFEVVKSIKDRGITCIVIAHRLSTIRDCDEIVVLDRGNVVERGTHDELMKHNGAYAKLVVSE